MLRDLPPDPLAALRPLLQGVGGLRQSDAVRRGLQLHATLPRPEIGTTPHTVIHTQNKLSLKYYAPASPRCRTPVVVIPSMINKAGIVDLEPDRSLVRSLAEAGHQVYLVDWGIPGDEDAGQTVADTLLSLLHRAVDRACRHAGAPRTHLLGYCQGGTLAAMYTALRPARVSGLATFNAPVRFREGGRFRQFVDGAHIDLDALIPRDRLLPVEVMQLAFRLLDPMGNWHKYAALDQIAEEPHRLRRTMARERWLEENVPMPGAFAREFIGRAYQDDALMEGDWQIAGERVDLRTITCPVAVFAAARDFIAPPASVMPLAEATGSSDVTAEVLDTGHIGIVVGAFGPRVFFPRLSAWFAAHEA